MTVEIMSVARPTDSPPHAMNPAPAASSAPTRHAQNRQPVMPLPREPGTSPAYWNRSHEYGPPGRSWHRPTSCGPLMRGEQQTAQLRVRLGAGPRPVKKGL